MVMTSFRIILMFFERLFLKRLLVLSIPFKYIASFSIPLGWFNWTARGASDFFERNNEKNVLRFDLFYSIVEKNLWHFTVFLYLKIWRNILTKNMLVYRKSFCHFVFLFEDKNSFDSQSSSQRMKWNYSNEVKITYMLKA